MAIDAKEVQANRDYFAHKLKAEKQRNDVLHAVESNNMDFVLLDTRGQQPFAAGHIPGAWCVEMAELDQAMSELPKDKEIVTYCWSHD